MATPEPRHEWVSVKLAAIHYGTSESDIRRRIKAGALVSESLARPGGTLLRVRIDAPEGGPTPSTVSEPEPRQDAPASADLIRAAIEPYVTMNERLAELYAGAMADNRQLAERVGRAEADAGRLQAELARLRRRQWFKPWTW